MLAWLSTDGKIVLGTRTIRSCIQGFFSVVVSVYLSLLGYSDLLIGLALSISIASSAAHIFIASFLERRYGRRKALAILAILSVVAGSVFVVYTNYLGFVVAVCIGPIGLGGTSAGAFQTVEQAIVAQSSSSEDRTRAFAAYNIGGWLANSGGALLVSVPTLLEVRGLGMVDSFKVLFALGVLAMLSITLLYLMLSKGAELTRGNGADAMNDRREKPVLSGESKGRIGRLSVLMGLDAFGGGFIGQNIASLWFFARFSASLDNLSLIFFGANIASTICFIVSASLARRIGLVNTMVFTHLPSNILTALIPFAPTIPFATAMFVVRGFLNPMDVAPRQSYIAAIVHPEERVVAAATTNIASNAGRAMSPSISGYLLQFVSLSSPFFLAGSLKAIYDLVLYQNFRKLKPPEEVSLRE